MIQKTVFGPVCYNPAASANRHLSHWRCHCHAHDNRNTFKYACSVCVWYMRSWNTSTEHAGIRLRQTTAVWSADLSRWCTVSVWGFSEWWSRDGASTSHGGPSSLCQSRLVLKLSPPSPSIPVISAPLSSSCSSPSGRQKPLKMSCTAESSLHGRHLHAGLTCQIQKLRSFFCQFSFYFMSRGKNKSNEQSTLHLAAHRQDRRHEEGKSIELFINSLHPDCLPSAGCLPSCSSCEELLLV